MQPAEQNVPARAGTSRIWLEALRQGAVLRRAAGLGLPVGVLQAIINQGDYWIARSVDTTIVAKTIISPLITFTVALASAAATYTARSRSKDL